MSIALGIVVATLLGGETGTPSTTPSTGYTIRIVEATAADWRGSHQLALRQVGRQAGSQVWVAPRATAEAIVDGDGSADKGGSKVAVAPGASCEVEAWTMRHFVTDVTRQILGPIKPVTRVGYIPHAEPIAEGYSVKLSGRESGRGVIAKVELKSAWVADVLETSTPKLIKPGVECSCVATVQLPQVVAANVAGEWTIPGGSVLLVSLGTHSVVGDAKKVRTVERLAIIEVDRPAADVVRVSHEGVIPAIVLSRGDVSDMRRGTPPLPSRSPQAAIGPDGREVALPPLPDPQVVVARVAGPSIPRPSPQTVNLPAGSLRFDPSIAPAHYEPMPIGRSEIRLDGRELASGRTQTLKIPLGGKIAIEVKARVVPADKPD